MFEFSNPSKVAIFSVISIICSIPPASVENFMLLCGFSRIVVSTFAVLSEDPRSICSRCVKPPKSHTNPAEMQHFAEGPCLFARWVWLSPSAIRVIATLMTFIHQCPTLDRATPSSRERLSLRDGCFVQRLFHR